MAQFPDEIRLGMLIAVNLFLVLACYRFARRWGGGEQTKSDWIAAAMDGLLLDYLVQYLAVCLPGVLGVLSAEMMLLAGCGAGAWLWWQGGKPDAGLGKPERLNWRDSLSCAGCLLFVIGYFSGLVQALSVAPLVGDDALTYHLPAAGQWLQSGRLSLYTTWFFNPANTYSPLAGSAFFFWLIAPLRCDVVAQFGQMPAMLLIFLALVQIGRATGARVWLAAVVALAALLSRPFISEAILVKDDHFLAAFFIVAVAGCGQDRLKDRLGPWRVGVAVGLFFATKYTALLTAPLFLLLWDAPRRAGWKMRQWAIALMLVAGIAGPWYVRNWVASGNPLYPVPVSVGGLQLFSGMFKPERSTEMRTLIGAWYAMTGAYSSIAPLLAGVLGTSWLLACVLHARGAIKQPLIRLCLLGPVVGLGVFFLASHAALIRYAYPSLLLLFLCCTLAIARLSRFPAGQVLLATGLAAVAVWGGFEAKPILQTFVIRGFAVAAVGCMVVGLIRQLGDRPQVRWGVCALASLVTMSWVYVYWPAVMLNARAHFTATPGDPEAGEMGLWKFVNEKASPNATIAYTNLVFTRPLMGFDYRHRVIYLPTRLGVREYSDLPSSDVKVTDQHIRQFVAELLVAKPDASGWRKRVMESEAEYLVVGRQPFLADPPEAGFAQADPSHFRREYADRSATVYRIIRLANLSQ